MRRHIAIGNGLAGTSAAEVIRKGRHRKVPFEKRGIQALAEGIAQYVYCSCHSASSGS
jgi:hypothetical protein